MCAQPAPRSTPARHPTASHATWRPIETELFEIGLANINSLLEPQHLAFFRLMVAESATAADLPMLVWNATHDLVVAQLEQYLRVKAPNAGFRIQDPRLAALQFIEASKSALHLEALFTGKRPTPEETRRRVRSIRASTP
jgi:hypothetical protein